jgi:uncharacterized small protein (DUF1192 family)
MSNNPDNSFCESTPADQINLDGDTYIAEQALARWGVVEVMVRNPAVSERISDLEARLEKAEAERDALKALAERQLGQMIEKAAQARNDALEEAAKAVEDHSQVGTRSAVAMAAYSNAANAVRKLKDKS